MLIFFDSPVTIVIDFYLKSWITIKITGCLTTGRTEQNFTSLSYNWMGKELQLRRLFVLKFSTVVLALQTGKAVVQISAP